jgi:hypothetical protein
MYVYNKVRVHLYFDVHHKMRSYGIEVFQHLESSSTRYFMLVLLMFIIICGNISDI